MDRKRCLEKAVKILQTNAAPSHCEREVLETLTLLRPSLDSQGWTSSEWDLWWRGVRLCLGSNDKVDLQNAIRLTHEIIGTCPRRAEHCETADDHAYFQGCIMAMKANNIALRLTDLLAHSAFYAVIVDALKSMRVVMDGVGCPNLVIDPLVQNVNHRARSLRLVTVKVLIEVLSVDSEVISDPSTSPVMQRGFHALCIGVLDCDPQVAIWALEGLQTLRSQPIWKECFSDVFDKAWQIAQRAKLRESVETLKRKSLHHITLGNVENRRQTRSGMLLPGLFLLPGFKDSSSDEAADRSAARSSVMEMDRGNRVAQEDLVVLETYILKLHAIENYVRHRVALETTPETAGSGPVPRAQSEALQSSSFDEKSTKAVLLRRAMQRSRPPSPGPTVGPRASFQPVNGPPTAEAPVGAARAAPPFKTGSFESPVRRPMTRQSFAEGPPHAALPPRQMQTAQERYGSPSLQWRQEPRVSGGASGHLGLVAASREFETGGPSLRMRDRAGSRNDSLRQWDFGRRAGSVKEGETPQFPKVSKLNVTALSPLSTCAGMTPHGVHSSLDEGGLAQHFLGGAAGDENSNGSSCDLLTLLPEQHLPTLQQRLPSLNRTGDSRIGSNRLMLEGLRKPLMQPRASRGIRRSEERPGIQSRSQSVGPVERMVPAAARPNPNLRKVVSPSARIERIERAREEEDIRSDIEPLAVTSHKFVPVVSKFLPRGSEGVPIPTIESFIDIWSQVSPTKPSLKRSTASWQLQLQALSLINRIVVCHPELVLDQDRSTIIDLALGTATAAESLRSCVAKAGLIAFGALVPCIRNHLDPVIDKVLPKILRRACDPSTSFLIQNAEEALHRLYAHASEGRLAKATLSQMSVAKASTARQKLAEGSAILFDRLTPQGMHRKEVAGVVSFCIDWTMDASADTRSAARVALSRLTSVEAFSSELSRSHLQKLIAVVGV